jgi:hypothetical protein
MLRSKQGINALFEIRHIVRPPILPAPLDNALCIYCKVAGRLPSISTLRRSDLDAFFFVQLGHAGNTAEHMPEAGRAQTPRSIHFSLSIHNDFEVGLAVPRRFGKCSEPFVRRSLVAVGDSYKLHVRMRGGNSAQLQKGLFGNCSGVSSCIA